MNKKLLAITSSLVLANVVPALAETTIELRSAAFFPMSHRFREIYGTVGVEYELEVSHTIPCSCWEIWTNLSWYPKHGHVGRSCGSSHVDVTNLSFGLQKSCQICDCFYWYAGIGPTFGWVFVENKRKCCSSGCSREDDNDSAIAVGGIVKGGLKYYVACNLFFDLFVDYLYEPAFFHDTVDVGGFRTGLGLGFSF